MGQDSEQGHEPTVNIVSTLGTLFSLIGDFTCIFGGAAWWYFTKHHDWLVPVAGSGRSSYPNKMPPASGGPGGAIGTCSVPGQVREYFRVVLGSETVDDGCWWCAGAGFKAAGSFVNHPGTQEGKRLPVAGLPGHPGARPWDKTQDRTMKPTVKSVCLTAVKPVYQPINK